MSRRRPGTNSVANRRTTGVAAESTGCSGVVTVGRTASAGRYSGCALGIRHPAVGPGGRHSHPGHAWAHHVHRPAHRQRVALIADGRHVAAADVRVHSIAGITPWPSTALRSVGPAVEATLLGTQGITGARCANGSRSPPGCLGRTIAIDPIARADAALHAASALSRRSKARCRRLRVTRARPNTARESVPGPRSQPRPWAAVRYLAVHQFGASAVIGTSGQ
jgi:hypothetical protein